MYVYVFTYINSIYLLSPVKNIFVSIAYTLSCQLLKPWTVDNSDFILFLQNLNNGIGSGYEYTCSNFWDDLDEYDKSQIQKFEGVEVGTQADEEIILSYGELLYYIKLIRERIITDKHNEVVIDKLISDFSKKYIEK